MKLLLLSPWLSEFRWFRRRIGGTWYYVRDNFEGGMQGKMTFWTQQLHPDYEVLKQEG